MSIDQQSHIQRISVMRGNLRQHAAEMDRVHTLEMESRFDADVGYHPSEATRGYQQWVDAFHVLEADQLSPEQNQRLAYLSSTLGRMGDEHRTIGATYTQFGYMYESQNARDFTERRMAELRQTGETFMVAGHERHFNIVRVRTLPDGGYSYTTYDAGHESVSLGRDEFGNHRVNAVIERRLRPGADPADLIRSTVVKSFSNAQTSTYELTRDYMDERLEREPMRIVEDNAQTRNNCTTMGQRVMLQDITGDQRITGRFYTFIADPNLTPEGLDNLLYKKALAVQANNSGAVRALNIDEAGWQPHKSNTVGMAFRYEIGPSHEPFPLDTAEFVERMQREGAKVGDKDGKAWLYVSKDDTPLLYETLRRNIGVTAAVSASSITEQWRYSSDPATSTLHQYLEFGLGRENVLEVKRGNGFTQVRVPEDFSRSNLERMGINSAGLDRTNHVITIPDDRLPSGFSEHVARLQASTEVTQPPRQPSPSVEQHQQPPAMPKHETAPLEPSADRAAHYASQLESQRAAQAKAIIAKQDWVVGRIKNHDEAGKVTGGTVHADAYINPADIHTDPQTGIKTHPLMKHLEHSGIKAEITTTTLGANPGESLTVVRVDMGQPVTTMENGKPKTVNGPNFVALKSAGADLSHIVPPESVIGDHWKPMMEEAKARAARSPGGEQAAPAPADALPAGGEAHVDTPRAPKPSALERHDARLRTDLGKGVGRATIAVDAAAAAAALARGDTDAALRHAEGAGINGAMEVVQHEGAVKAVVKGAEIAVEAVGWRAGKAAVKAVAGKIPGVGAAVGAVFMVGETGYEAVQAIRGKSEWTKVGSTALSGLAGTLGGLVGFGAGEGLQEVVHEGTKRAFGEKNAAAHSGTGELVILARDTINENSKGTDWRSKQAAAAVAAERARAKAATPEAGLHDAFKGRGGAMHAAQELKALEASLGKGAVEEVRQAIAQKKITIGQIDKNHDGELDVAEGRAAAARVHSSTKAQTAGHGR